MWCKSIFWRKLALYLIYYSVTLLESTSTVEIYIQLDQNDIENMITLIRVYAKNYSIFLGRNKVWHIKNTFGCNWEIVLSLLYIKFTVWSYLEYYLEDCIQMLNFIPPPNDRKKKRDRDEEDETGDSEVYYVTISSPCKIHDENYSAVIVMGILQLKYMTVSVRKWPIMLF